MLNTLTRKLCPFMYLAIATMGCGKKITEPKSVLSRQTENQELPSTYIIRLDGSEASRKNFAMPGPAQFEIPDRLIVKQGATIKKVVEVAYDVNEFDSDDYQFKCSYYASTSPQEMILTSCVDYDGNDFGDLSGQKFTLRYNDTIQMRFTGAPSSDLIVEAIYSMRWI
jgi:hypothetical protein